MKRWLKKLFKFNAVLVILGLIFGMTSFTPTVSAKTTYKTLAFDKKLETAQDFEKGEFKNTRIDKTADGVEIGSSDGKGEYITPVIQAPFGATHIGLHWKEKESGKNLVTAFIRTSDDGINFGEWIQTSVELDESRDDKKNEEVFAALVGTENDSFAQAGIEFIPTEGISPKLKNLTFTFINSGEESKQVTKELSLVPKSIAAGVGTLKTSPHGQNINVISREDWGADESYRFKAGAEDWARSYHGTRKLIVHHTAGLASNGQTDLETNKTTVRAIYYYHAITQQWGDIGYNALVDATGNVYEGRYGTHDTATRSNPTADQVMALDVEAGHTSGYNSGSFGVSAMGDFTSFDIPSAQSEGLKNVLAYVADSRGINTQGSSDFRRYDGSWHNDLNNVIAHRDATATACPGDRLYAQVTTIKTDVDNLLDVATSNLSNFSATLNFSPISGTSIGLGTINFSWSAFSGATQYQYALERVFGTPGVASDSEPWNTAWLNPENTNIQSTSATGVQIDAGTLQTNSNYVFYVRALDANGSPISTVSHVNFVKDSSIPVIDITAPAVAINNPADGAMVSGIVAIGATATDAIGVTRVDFYANSQLIGSDNSFPYSFDWDSKTVGDGAIVPISAKAYDAANNVGESSSINITVNNAPISDVTAPVATINSPVDLSIVSGVAPINVTATDNIGVANVEFYINGQLIGSDSISPYNFNWDSKTVADGAVLIVVKAFDATGNVGASSNINVTVNNTVVADTTAPIVTIKSPIQGANVKSGTVSISSSATDNVKVASMKLFIDGKQMATSSKGSLSYSWNTKRITVGLHTIKVQAYDAAGNIGEATITVNRVK